MAAGIAQLVEQATENRRVPSSNLGPGINKSNVQIVSEWQVRIRFIIKIVHWRNNLNQILTSYI